MAMNIEVLNGEEQDETGEVIEWSGEHSNKTMFRSELMYRVSISYCLRFSQLTFLDGCRVPLWSLRTRRSYQREAVPTTAKWRHSRFGVGSRLRHTWLHCYVRNICTYWALGLNLHCTMHVSYTHRFCTVYRPIPPSMPLGKLLASSTKLVMISTRSGFRQGSLTETRTLSLWLTSGMTCFSRTVVYRLTVLVTTTMPTQILSRPYSASELPVHSLSGLH
jgi:hypothetical protein